MIILLKIIIHHFFTKDDNLTENMFFKPEMCFGAGMIKKIYLARKYTFLDIIG